MTPRERYIRDHAPTMLIVLATRSVPGAKLDLDAAIRLAGGLWDRIETQAREAVPVGEQPAGAVACPHQAIITLYHELLPMCPRVRSWIGARPALLRSRWREHPDLDWWRGYFTYVAESAFLTGRTGTKDRRPFLADLEWLIRPANFGRVHEGKYHGV